MSHERPGRCWYCGETKLREDDPPEHVIPAALGGTLMTDRVCRQCNQRAGKQIDAPLQNDWLVAQAKLLHKVESSRKGASGKAKTGRMEAHVKGEPSRTVDIGRDRSAQVRSSIEEESEGRLRISAGSEDEAKRLRDRLVKRLEAEGRAIESEEIKQTEFDQLEVKFTLDGVTWLRAAAKMTLGTLSLCVDEKWLDSDEAKRLRRWLWDEEPTNDDGTPAFAVPAQPHDAELLVAPPPTHLITIMPTVSEGRVVVSQGLFGGLYLRAGVEASPPLPDTCWVIVPGERPRTLSRRQLIEEATRRYIEKHESEAADAET